MRVPQQITKALVLKRTRAYIPCYHLRSQTTRIVCLNKSDPAIRLWRDNVRLIRRSLLVYHVRCAAQGGIHLQLFTRLSSAGNFLWVSLQTTRSCHSFFVFENYYSAERWRLSRENAMFVLHPFNYCFICKYFFLIFTDDHDQDITPPITINKNSIAVIYPPHISSLFSISVPWYRRPTPIAAIGIGSHNNAPINNRPPLISCPNKNKHVDKTPGKEISVKTKRILWKKTSFFNHAFSLSFIYHLSLR